MIAQYNNNGRIAIQLSDPEDGEPIAMATVNVVEQPNPPKYWIDVKDYSENAGMVLALMAAGIISGNMTLAGVAYRCEVTHPVVKEVMDEFYAG